MEAGLLRSTPARYGRACSNCVKAKCRCMIRGDGSSICDRCVIDPIPSTIPRQIDCRMARKGICALCTTGEDGHSAGVLAVAHLATCVTTYDAGHATHS
jgi:hypothetical protein